MLRAFRFKITEIASRLPSFLYECFIQEFGAVYCLPGFFRIASFPGSLVQPNTDPGLFAKRGNKANYAEWPRQLSRMKQYDAGSGKVHSLVASASKKS